jgi:hypothetical protein
MRLAHAQSLRASLCFANFRSLAGFALVSSARILVAAA